MDWRAGVGWSVGDGTGEVATFLDSGPGYGCCYPAASECLLITTNLDVLDQYALSLQGTASKILELGLHPRGFPSTEVAAGALGPQVRRASVQMEAMGLWQPSLDPVMIP